MSPTATRPDTTVPVTIVPWPGSVKTRSTARRNRPSSRFIRHAAAAACRCAFSSATPGSSARTAQVSNTGASWSTLPLRNARTSSCTSCRRCASTHGPPWSARLRHAAYRAVRQSPDARAFAASRRHRRLRPAMRNRCRIAPASIVCTRPLVAWHVDEAEHVAESQGLDTRSRGRSKCRAPFLPCSRSVSTPVSARTSVVLP